MDPNANLAEQHRLLPGSDPGRLLELRQALATWLSSGGFAPDRKAHPRAWQAYVAWVGRQAGLQRLP